MAEARAYLAHPVLGPRLRECTQLVNAINGRSIEAIFEFPDNLKFHSCITLFGHICQEPVFIDALNKYFNRETDCKTLALL